MQVIEENTYTTNALENLYMVNGFFVVNEKKWGVRKTLNSKNEAEFTDFLKAAEYCLKMSPGDTKGGYPR